MGSKTVECKILQPRWEVMEIHELVDLEQLKMKKINYIQFSNSRELKPIVFQ